MAMTQTKNVHVSRSQQTLFGKSHVWRHIMQILSCSKGQILILIGLCIAGALLPSLSPLIYANIIDVLIPQGELRNLLIYIALLMCIPVGSSIVSNYRNIAAYRVSTAVTKGLRRAVFQKIMSMDQAEYQKMGVSALAYRVTRACGQIGDVFLNNTVISLINSSLTLLMVFIPMFCLDCRLAAAALIAVPLIYGLLNYVKKHVAEKDKTLLDTMQEGDRIIRESLAGMREIKLFGGQLRQMKRMEQWLNDQENSKMESGRIHEFERVTLPEFCLQVLYGVIFVLGAVLAAGGAMSTGTLVAFIAYLPRAFASIRQLLGIQVTLQSIGPTIACVDEIFDSPEEDSGDYVISDCKGEIAFESVSFEYSLDSRFVLQDISFTVKPCEAIAIVGETGGGKSTILDLMLRLYRPRSGRILLDGVEVQNISLDSYRSQYAVVQQTHFLWADSVKSNIVYPAEEADAAQFDQAVRAGQLQGFLEGLPEKEDTLLGEKGQSVSGGERQRISMAHAVYQDRRILILDEPTSALDAQTEEKLRDELLKYKGKKTIVAVTHRLSTILEFDRVLVLHGGRIVEEGRPKELMNKASRFRKMCCAQGLIAGETE